MNDLEKEKQEAWKNCFKAKGAIAEFTSFKYGFDAGVKAERERIKKELVKYTDVDHVIFDEEIFPDEVVNGN